MIVLDTNVVSESLRNAPHPGVIAWLDAWPLDTLFVTAVTEAELRFGIELLPAGRRRDSLHAQVQGALREDFAGRILPFDSQAAQAYAVIAAARRAAGRPISHPDGQIAAIARSHGASLATRDVHDFQGCGIDVADPWSSNPNPTP